MRLGLGPLIHTAFCKNLPVVCPTCVYAEELAMTENRRSDKRVSVNLPARWDGLSGEHEARIEDIGMGGCFVNTVSRVTVGEVIGLEIKMPSGEWLPLRGEVTSYQEAVGFGMVFTFLTENEELTLRKITG